MHFDLSMIHAALPILAQVGEEAAKTNAEMASSFELSHMWGQMGWVARGVAITLGIMSLISIGLFIERMLTYSRADKQSLRFAKLVTEHLMENKLGEAVEAADSKQFESSHVARVCGAGIREFLSGRTGGADVVESARKSIERAIQTETLDLRRGLSALATVANTAPFVGLFGTVWGIMTSFAGIAAAKDTSLAVVAPGIAEALAATAIGLAAAIPAAFAYNRLAAAFGITARSLNRLIEDYGTRLARENTVAPMRKKIA